MIEEAKWTVVEFVGEEEGIISTVPKNWLQYTNECTATWWPKDNIRKHIKRASSPDESWKLFQVIDMMTSAVTYKEAIAFEKKKEKNETTDSDNNKEPVRKRRKYKEEDYAYSSNDEGSCIPNPPYFDLGEQESLADTVSFTSAELMPPPTVPAVTEMEKNDEVHQIIEVLEGQASAGSQNSKCDTVSLSDFMAENSMIDITKNTDILNNILKQVTETRIMLERLLNNLPTQNISGEIPRISNFDWLPNDQFKKFGELLKFDKKISENSLMQEQLYSIFKLSGGATGKENIIRGLKKLLSDKLAKKCSLLGRKGNFPIGNMKWLNLLKDSARTYGITDKDFESIVSNWLRQANLRYIRWKEQKENGK